MDKITFRFFLVAFIFGLISISGNTLMANSYYGPEKPVLKEQFQKNSFFIGFFLEAEPSISLIENTPTSCANSTDGALEISVSGGEYPYTYSWTGPNSYSGTGTKITGLAPGNYTVIVTDNTNETATESFTITKPNQLEINSTFITAVSCNSGSNGSVSVTEVIGGTEPYEYNLENIYQSSPDFNNLSAGNYTLTVKDSNGCEVSKEINVSEPSILTMASPQVENVTCFEGNNGSITAGNVSGGNGDYTFSLDNNSYQTGNTFTDLTAGSYTIYVKDSKDCVAQQDFSISQPPILNAIITATSVSCFNSNNGKILFSSAEGGSGSYEFSVNNGNSWQTNPEFENLSNSNYQVLIRDANANNCTIVLNANLVITQPAEILAEVTSEDISCYGANDGSISISGMQGGSGNFQYSIDGGNSWSGNPLFEDLPPGSYTVRIRDANEPDCIKVLENIQITQPPVLTATISSTQVSCFGASNGSISINNAQGGYGTYEFSIDNGINWQVSNQFENLSNGSYQVIIRDAENPNCEFVLNNSLEITQPEILNAEITSGNVTCNGNNDGSILLENPTGGEGRYQYSINGGNSWENDGDYFDLSNGLYNIQIRDRDKPACIVILNETFEITQTAELSISGTTSTPPTCFGGQDGTITSGSISGGTPPYKYSIDNTNFNTTGNFENVPAGNQTIFIVDANNCALQTNIFVEEPGLLNASINAVNVDCFDGNDGELSLSNLSGGSGNYEFSIDGNNWYPENESITELTAQNYQVLLRDANNPGCIVNLDENFEITQPSALLEAEVSAQRTTTYGTATGSATVNPSGGTPGYIYEWRKAGSEAIIQHTQTASNIPAGDYEVTIIDRNDCEIIKAVSVTDIINAPIIPTSICENEEDLIRTSYFEVEDLTARGGVGPYTYEWNFGNDATPQTATGAGSHRVTYETTGNKEISVIVTDSLGESIKSTYTQYVGECYVDDCGSNDFDGTDFFIGDSQGNPITSTNCGSGTMKYVYVDLSTSPQRYSLYIEFIYSIKKEDGSTIQIKDGGPFYCKEDIPDIAQTIQINDWECGDIITVENVYLTFSNNKKWECGQGPDPKCFSTNDGSTVSTPLFGRLAANEIACYGVNDGILTVTASGGTPAYDYSLSENGPYQTTNEFYSLPAGTYTVWIRDSKGDKFETEAETIIEPLSELTTTITTNEPVCFGEPANAMAHPEGGIPFTDGNGDEYYEYLWNDPAQQITQTASDLEPGDYSVTIKDSQGCQTIEYVTVSTPLQVSQPKAGEDQFFNCGFTSANLEANTPEVGIGSWQVIEGPDEGNFSDPTSPTATFSGNSGTYLLEWTIAFENGSCSRSDTVSITFSAECVTLDFDGEDDYIFVGNEFNFSSGNFTLEAWIKPHSIQGLQSILSKRNIRNLGAGGFDLSINNGSPVFRWGNSTVSSANKVNAKRWHHIAAIYKDSRVELFVDGISVSNASATNPSTIDAPFLIAAIFDANNPEIPQNYFQGWIEEMRLWGRALSKEQLRFLMNQRLDLAANRGDVLPMDIPGGLTFENDLKAYYPLIATDAQDGITRDLGPGGLDGQLRNIETLQENTAPLPYISANNGSWRDINIWQEPDVWEPPNSNGINGAPINWNIAEISHNISSGSNDIYLLGLLSEENRLSMANETTPDNEYNSGQGLTISHYLRLNGNIDLVGESQLVQNEGSILEEASSGYVEKDQQGTANSYNYNYWTSPVSFQGPTNNSGYTIKGMMKDGTNSNNPQILSFAYPHTHADGNYTGNKRISSYWLYKFHGTANTYGEWRWIGENGNLQAGEGFTMKGTLGSAPITDDQNYVFRGKPNNGTITLSISDEENRLLGNPYPSAIDAEQFIRDNLKDIPGGNRDLNVFNGALYFWDHFGQENTHILRDYVGGYATYNLSGGVKAASTDERINANGDGGNKTPGRYIPVAQGFFVNSVLDESLSGNYTISGGDITFKNGQRTFVRESSGDSQFLKPEYPEKEKNKEKLTEDTRYKIRLDFHSPTGYNRQILVTADIKTTNGFDLGFDAPLMDNAKEDMYWLINDHKFVIQGVPHFNIEQVLPLGIKIAEEGDFNISLAESENLPENIEIYIRDNTDSTYFDIRIDKFTANIQPGLYDDQYDIVFYNGSKVDKEEPETGNIEIGYSFNTRQLNIANPELWEIKEIRIFSINGQEVDYFNNIPNEKEINLPVEKPLSSAVYIVKMYTREGDFAKKIIIKR